MNVLSLNASKARRFFLKEENYASFDLPGYFSFSDLLDKISQKLDGKKLTDFYSGDPKYVDNVNYKLLSNKDGKYAWRPFQLIHPALYVSLVHQITQKQNWDTIKRRFEEIAPRYTECCSLPVVPPRKKKGRAEQILHWWETIEQKSITLSLEYEFVFHSDIVDCYGAIYTHSVAWAIAGKDNAKNNRNDKKFIGNIIDQHIQSMSYGQTNGIPQGSVLMDFIAEIVLLYVDNLVEARLRAKVTDFKILRYRDDYRIFVNNPQDGEKIVKVLSEVLSDMGMKLSVAKTSQSAHPVHSAVKPDKLFWISNQCESEKLPEALYIISSLAEKFPNSGTVVKLMKHFYEQLNKARKQSKDLGKDNVLISLVVDIAFRNPKVYPLSSAILSKLLSLKSKNSEKQEVLQKIRNKFDKIPNTGTLMVWLQRISFPLDGNIEYSELLCRKACDDSVEIWNSSWLKPPMQKLLASTPIIDRKEIKRLKPVIPLSEVDLFSSMYY